MRSGKEKPWWVSPSVFDIMIADKVRREYNSALTQRIAHQLAIAKYPTRPNRAKCDWTEPVSLDGTKYFLSCGIDEDAHKIVINYITTRKNKHKPAEN